MAKLDTSVFQDADAIQYIYVENGYLEVNGAEKKYDEDRDSINEEFFKRCIASVILFDTLDALISKAEWYPKGGNKAQIIPYSISKLFTMIPKDKDIDWEYIWNKQTLYPELAEGKGFPADIGIADDGYLGVECLYPSNVDLFSLYSRKENSDSITPTNKYPAEELNHYLLPIRYEENSHNNYFVLIFTIGETEYKSAPYYFDYAHHEQAVEMGKGKYITLYPSL